MYEKGRKPGQKKPLEQRENQQQTQPSTAASIALSLLPYPCLLAMLSKVLPLSNAALYCSVHCALTTAVSLLACYAIKSTTTIKRSPLLQRPLRSHYCGIPACLLCYQKYYHYQTQPSTAASIALSLLRYPCLLAMLSKVLPLSNAALYCSVHCALTTAVSLLACYAIKSTTTIKRSPLLQRPLRSHYCGIPACLLCYQKYYHYQTQPSTAASIALSLLRYPCLLAMLSKVLPLLQRPLCSHYCGIPACLLCYQKYYHYQTQPSTAASIALSLLRYPCLLAMLSKVLPLSNAALYCSVHCALTTAVSLLACYAIKSTTTIKRSPLLQRPLCSHYCGIPACLLCYQKYYHYQTQPSTAASIALSLLRYPCLLAMLSKVLPLSN